MNSLINYFLFWMKQLGETANNASGGRISQQVDWQHIEQTRGRLVKMRAKSQTSAKAAVESYMTDVDRENTSIGSIIPMKRLQNNGSGVSHWAGASNNPIDVQLKDSLYGTTPRSSTFADSDWQYSQASKSYNIAVPPELDLQQPVAGLLPAYGPEHDAMAPQVYEPAAPLDFKPAALSTSAYFNSYDDAAQSKARFSYATESRANAFKPEPDSYYDIDEGRSYSQTSGLPMRASSSVPPAYQHEYSADELELLDKIRAEAQSNGGSFQANDASEALAEAEARWFGITGENPVIDPAALEAARAEQNTNVVAPAPLSESKTH